MALKRLLEYGKIPVKDSNFSNFTDWFDYRSLSSYSDLKWCSHYLCSQTKAFAWKYPMMKKLKASSEFHVNHLTLQNCESKFKSHISKELIHKISTNLRNFLLIFALIFANSKKLAFHRHLFSQIRPKCLFCVYWFSPKFCTHIVLRKWWNLQNSLWFLRCGKIFHRIFKVQTIESILSSCIWRKDDQSLHCQKQITV